MSAESIEIYDLKYLLSSAKGAIFRRKARRYAAHRAGSPDIVYVNHGSWSTRRLHRDCAMNRDAALELADELRQRKIRNLQRQIERLQALEFTIVEEGNG